MKRGVCGGGYSKVNTSHYGCATAKNKGQTYYANRRLIKQKLLEDNILSTLQTRLMKPELVEVFCEEYKKHLNELNRAQSTQIRTNQKEAEALNKERGNLIQALKDGVGAALVKDDLERVCARLDEVGTLLEQSEETVQPILHPAMALRYREQVMSLRKSLSDKEHQAEASELLRRLIEKVVLTPKDNGELQVDLYGNLAGILNMSLEEKEKLSEDKLGWLQLLFIKKNTETK